VSHNLARPGGLRRALKIPNPIPYFQLATRIAADWPAIRSHTWKQRLSASRPYFDSHADRAVVPRYAYRELTRLRALRRRAGRYLLVTDISQFYSSIYTHAIPWALHSKQTCKAELKKPKKQRMQLLGDSLDDAMRQMNDGQTLGVPIGPDASLVVAEVLLAAVDDLIVSKEFWHAGFRYVDDYELTFDSLSEAEDALVELEGALADFELRVNPRKTRILELPLPLDKPWSHDLGILTIRGPENPVGQRNDILALFSRAFEQAEKHPGDSILRYAVAKVQGLDVHRDGWRSFHNCLLGAAGADPSTLPVVLGSLFEVGRRGGHQVPKGPLGEVLESIIGRHAGRAHGSEVAWAVYAALVWSVQLSAEAARAISGMSDDIVALLALHGDERRIFPVGALDRTIWTDLVSGDDALVGEHWLLAYEATQRGWLSSPAFGTEKHYEAMRSADVSFYDEERLDPHFPAAGRSMPGGSMWRDYA
jgi:Reverse transcriptase (RNA-dependent DNA polymerase)